jgi:hypothetical protein
MDPRTGMPYSIKQYVEMHFLYGKHEGSANAAATEFRERYHTTTSHHTVLGVVDRLKETGSVVPRPREIGMSAARAEEIDIVEAAVEENPSVSVRDIARIPGVRSRSSAHRALQFSGLHSFHAYPVQNLEEGDHQQRRGLARWFQANQNSLERILFTDESQFTRETVINSRNYTLWAESNPYATRPRRFQRQLHVNVWAGIIGNSLIGPYFIPPRLNSQYYLEFLIENIDEFLENVPSSARRQGLYFQQDGCPAHSAGIITTWLNHRFPNRWLGRYGPIFWAPRSPDFTPLDFYLWGELKRLVYENQQVVETIDELQERSDQAFV